MRRRVLLLLALLGGAGASLTGWRNAAAQPCERQCAPELRDASGCCPQSHVQTHATTHVAPPPPPPPSYGCPGDMASIPRGNNADGPVPGFCLDRLEVTTAAYTGCVNTGACTAEHVREQGTSSAGFVFDPTCNYSTDRMNHPMNCVDWGQAVTYCASKGKRLPSETEFVWAAHGASAGTTYPWGNDEPQAQLCWSGLSRRESTCAGMTFPGGNSPQGVADLAGDVWEWTSSADGSGKVNLGGSWVTTSAAKLAASNRNSNTTSYRSNALGFRCARSLP